MKHIFFAKLIFLVFTIGVLGQSPKNVTFYQDVNWSPDGKYLSFTRIKMTIVGKTRTMKSDVYFAKQDGTGLTRVSNDNISAMYSVWSKDGDKIVFSVSNMETKAAEIFITNTNGTGQKQLTASKGRNSAPSFSPDGEKIAFISNRDGGQYQVYVMDTEGKNQRRLTADSNIAYYSPQWSADSKKITYYSEKRDNKDQIWMMDADGKNKRLLTANIGHNIYPSFLPNGDIVFISARNGERGLVCTVGRDGSNFQLVQEFKASFVRFSPDGRKVAYINRKSGKSEIYIANADGSETRKLLKQN